MPDDTLKAPAKAAVKSVKPAKKTLTVKWGKVSGGTVYGKWSAVKNKKTK